MRRALPSLLLTAAVLTACSQHALPTASVRGAETAAARSVPGRLLLRWKNPAAAAAVLKKLGIMRAEALGDGAAAPDVIDLPAGISASQFQAAAGDALEWAEADRILTLINPTETTEADDTLTASAAKKASSNDPKRKAQWGLDKINIDAAWKITRGNANVKIAIIDTGADLEHPDLKGQIADSWRASGFFGRMGLASAKDDNGHGTHCAGIAAALADNGEGGAGVAPGCKLLVVKALDAEGAGPTSDIVRGIRWAVSNGARVISLSMGGEGQSRALESAVSDAIRAGVVVVAAMGNEGKQQRNYPAGYPGVIAVGSTTKTDKVSNFSTRGAWISVSAPGSSILSTAPTYAVTMTRAGDMEKNYGTLDGTSMATPMVAGLAALVLSKNPGWSPAQVKAAIEKGATALTGTTFPKAGHGRIDAAKTLAAR